MVNENLVKDLQKKLITFQRLLCTLIFNSTAWDFTLQTSIMENSTEALTEVALTM